MTDTDDTAEHPTTPVTVPPPTRPNRVTQVAAWVGIVAGTVFVVAVIFGLVNAVIKPVVQVISIPLYILTLGLFHVVINALMLWITSWITENTTGWGLQIDDFWWTAIWAAIVLSIVGWLLSLITGDMKRSAQ